MFKSFMRAASGVVLGLAMGNLALPGEAQAQRYLTTPATNKDDIRPALREIMDEVKKRAATATPEKPLFVILGENHPKSAQILIGQLLVTGFQSYAKEEGMKIAYAYEQPHNFSTKFLQQQAKTFPGLIPDDWKSRHDKDGLLSLKISESFIALSGATYAYANMRTALIEAGVFSAPVDAAKDGKNLDLSDSITKKYVDKLGIKSELIDVQYSDDGINVRNYVAADRSVMLAQDSGASVVFMTIGQRHVFAGDDHVESYPHSVPAILEGLGHNVLTVALETSRVPADKLEIAKKQKNTLFPFNVPNVYFFNETQDLALLTVERNSIEKMCWVAGEPNGCFQSRASMQAYTKPVASHVLELAVQAGRLPASAAPR